MEPSRFSELADPLLKGDYPKKCFNQAVAVAAMCLQEDVNVRPSIGDVVTALSCLPAEGEGGHSRPVSPPSPQVIESRNQSEKSKTAEQREREVAEAIAWGSKSRHNTQNL